MPLSPKTKHPNVSRKLRFLLIFPYFLSILSLSFRKKRGLAPFPLNLPFDYATLSCPYPISFSRVALRLWNRFITFTTHIQTHMLHIFNFGKITQNWLPNTKMRKKEGRGDLGHLLEMTIPFQEFEKPYCEHT
jgi:hypothetical protein